MNDQLVNEWNAVGVGEGRLGLVLERRAVDAAAPREMAADRAALAQEQVAVAQDGQLPKERVLAVGVAIIVVEDGIVRRVRRL